MTVATVTLRTSLRGRPLLFGVGRSASRFRSIVSRITVDRITSAESDLQSFLARFDGDNDGHLTYAEAREAFAAIQSQQLSALAKAQAAGAPPAVAPTPPPTAARPAAPSSTWDLQVLNGIRGARSRGQSPLAALLAFISAKLGNTGAARARASDLVWSFSGMFLAVTALGLMNAHVKAWPVVGQWHQQGLGLLLGSFGTLCVLIFGRPDSEAVRLWNLLAGHVVATATVLTLLHVLGPGVFSRALAMACMIATMLATDCVHPPGGALVLLAVDSAAIQRMDWWFMLYPSLAVTIALLLPLGVAVNWLKRNVKFDFPATAGAAPAPPGPASATPELRPKWA